MPASQPRKKTAAKTSARSSGTSRKKTAKKTARKTTRKTAPTAPAQPALHEREPREVIEVAGYALAGLAADAAELARQLPERFESLRDELIKAAGTAPWRVSALTTEAPGRVRSNVEDTRNRILEDLEVWRDGLERAVERKAEEGRKVATTVREDDRIKAVLSQTGNTRSQVKAAVTSLRKTATLAFEAGRGQADTAASQTKAAATSARKSAEAVAEAVADSDEIVDAAVEGK